MTLKLLSHAKRSLFVSTPAAAAATLAAGMMMLPLYGRTQTIHFGVFDGRNYAPAQLPLAARSPVQNESPKLDRGVYLVPRSADGQYHLAGWINGYPVVFLVDTGATVSAIPLHEARNAGIRAGQQVVVSAANGLATSWTSKANVLSFGGFTVSDVDVQVVEHLQFPLLGMNVLNRFQIGYANGDMTLKIAQ